MGIDVTEEKRLRKGLEQQTEQLRELAGELTLAEQHERRRIAETLHDNLQQLLVAAKMHVAMLRREKNPEVQKAADEVDDMLSQSIAATRTLTSELMPFLLHKGELGPAMGWLAKWMSEKHGLTVNVKIAEKMSGIREDIAILLFQSTRELLFNAAKHAKVKTAQLELTMKNDRLKIVVSDEGAGFDPSQLSINGGKDGGLGLLSVRERMGLMGGSMAVEAAPGIGTQITLESPPLTPSRAMSKKMQKG